MTHVKCTMSLKCLTLCLFLIVFIEVKCQVCTSTRTTQTGTFTLSGTVMKNKVMNAPTFEIIKKCCPGYYTVNPHEEPSNTNCLKICNLNCTDMCKGDEHCLCGEGYIKDTTGTLCIPKCDSGYYNITNGSCPNLNSQKPKDSTTEMTEIEKATDYVNCSVSSESISEKSCPFVFFLSVSANIVLLLIIIILVVAKCKNHGRDNKHDISEHRNSHEDIDSIRLNPASYMRNASAPENVMPSNTNTHYLPMGSADQHNRADPPQYESIHCGVGEELRYDYVQTPLPIHLRKPLPAPHSNRSKTLHN